MVEQTLFGLTWVLAASLLPFTNRDFAQSFDWMSWPKWLAIFFAFTFARTAGMAWNRWIDAAIDEENPRTRSRVLPSGESSPKAVMVIALLSSALFLIACGSINTPCAVMGPICLGLIFLYSFLKRFTSCCHLVMGLISGLGPVCAWLAMTDQWEGAAFLLGGALMASIAANDVVYSLQDHAFDRERGLYSLPVVLGPHKALVFARFLHGVALLLLFLLGSLLELPMVYFGGVAVVGAFLLSYHRTLSPRSSPEQLNGFLACNSWVGMSLLITTIGTVAWVGMS